MDVQRRLLRQSVRQLRRTRRASRGCNGQTGAGVHHRPHALCGRGPSATGRHATHREGVPVQQSEGGRLPRRPNRHALGGGERRHHRQRRRRHRRRRSRIARGSLGLARGVEGHHQQAGTHCHQYPLSLRSCAWQPGLRKRGRHHRPRVHARDAARRQVARDASVQELRRAGFHDRSRICRSGSRPSPTPRGRRRCRRSFRPPRTTGFHKRN